MRKANTCAASCVLATPSPKSGRSLSQKTQNLVISFYEDDVTWLDGQAKSHFTALSILTINHEIYLRYQESDSKIRGSSDSNQITLRNRVSKDKKYFRHSFRRQRWYIRKKGENESTCLTISIMLVEFHMLNTF